MLSPGAFAPYVGFTESEVIELCDRYDMDFDTVKRWYDGYLLADYHTALQQIKERRYTDSLTQYTGDILLVGINYDKKSKTHTCVIEELQKDS